MQRYLEPKLLRDLACKTVVLTGARQVGKTTLARQLMDRFERAQYLNWEVPLGSARMETFRESGESLAGRHLHLHLAPISVREWCTHG